MAVTNARQAVDLLIDFLAPDKDSTAMALVKKLFHRRWSAVKFVADAAANTAYEIPIESSLDYDVQVDAVKVLPGAALTGDANNNATITLEYDDGAGGANTVVATVTTTANWTAQTPVDVPVTAANAKVAAGKQLIVKVAKNGTGVAVPACTFYVHALPA